MKFEKRYLCIHRAAAKESMHRLQEVVMIDDSRLVATDGRMLVLLMRPGEEEDKLIGQQVRIPASVMADVERAASTYGGVEISVADDGWTRIAILDIDETEREVRLIPPVEGEMADVDVVAGQMDGLEPLATINLDFRYLRTLADMQEALFPGRSALKLEIFGPKKPVRISAPLFRVLLMPVEIS